jgi:sulfur-oxidizing protein SoxY
MAKTRRSFLRSVIGLLLAIGAGRVWPKKPPSSSRQIDKLAKAIDAETGGIKPTESAEIRLTAPDIAEDGALVPVTVECALAEAKAIWIFVEKNPEPLVARFSLSTALAPFVSLRVKMNESCDLVALVQVGEEYFSVRKSVRVMLGGCG